MPVVSITSTVQATFIETTSSRFRRNLPEIICSVLRDERAIPDLRESDQTATVNKVAEVDSYGRQTSFNEYFITTAKLATVFTNRESQQRPLRLSLFVARRRFPAGYYHSVLSAPLIPWRMSQLARQFRQLCRLNCPHGHLASSLGQQAAFKAPLCSYAAEQRRRHCCRFVDLVTKSVDF